MLLLTNGNEVMNLRKGLTIVGLLFIILIVSSELLLPRFITGAMRERLVERVATDEVTVNISTKPACLMLLGSFDNLEAVAHNAKVGQVYVKELTLTGTDVKLNADALFSDEEVAIKSAKSLELKGIIDEENLREVLARKIDKVENLAVSIDPDSVNVTANIKIFGRMADVDLEGKVVEDSGSLYFMMNRLDIKNTRLGTARLGDLFGNIQLAAVGTLPMGLKITDVKQTHGTIVVTADNK